MGLETEKLELDTKIALAEKDLISNSHNEIKSLKQKVEELQNSVEKEKNVNRIVESERDKFKCRLEELRVYRDKYDAEKRRRQDLEREFDVYKKSNKHEDPNEDKLKMKDNLQSLKNEIKVLHDRDAKQKEELRIRNQAFEELKGEMKKRALSIDEDLHGQSKFKKMETNSDVSTTRKEL